MSKSKKQTLFETAIETARYVAETTPALREFVDWPQDLIYAERRHVPAPAIEELQTHPGVACTKTKDLQGALLALADQVEWRLSYSEKEVGWDFLNRFGWFELAGPQEGHFKTQTTRLTVGYWGPNLDYPWHLHKAEELYFVVSGSAEFEVKGQSPKILRAGDSIFHASNQPHAMRTQDSGILTFVLWRGQGLGDPPKMET